jgi:23S rRNA (uracil1939-C5)-methyltransferase
VDEVERIFFVGSDFSITGPYCDKGEENEALNNTFNVHYPNIIQLRRHLNLSWEVGGFCQVNLAQNKILIETVLEFSQVEKTETVLDLYCGMGNFSIPLAMAAKEVLGIEGQGSAIRSAKENAFNAALTNTIFLKKPVDNACKELAAKGEHFDCVVIDPPRQGALGLAGYLAKITSKRLIYISCDPATLCRDLADLTNEGFSIKKIQPIDMFPQTHHIENVVLLEK